jgi:hypothetical protein
VTSRTSKQGRDARVLVNDVIPAGTGYMVCLLVMGLSRPVNTYTNGVQGFTDQNLSMLLHAFTFCNFHASSRGKVLVSQIVVLSEFLTKSCEM